MTQLAPSTERRGKAGAFRWALFDLPPVLFVVAIFHLGSLPPDQLHDLSWTLWDKLEHALAFGVLAWLMERSLGYHLGRMGALRRRGLAVVVASLAGGFLELYQSLFPGRNPDVWDWVADTVGAVAAMLVLVAFDRLRSHAVT